jgi:hypothetical protein
VHVRCGSDLFTMKRSLLWARWKRLAHGAAVIQSHVLLAIVYALIVVPIGLVRRRAAREFRAPAATPAWRPRATPAQTQASARRQS